jgi:hypothetical protein
MRTSLRLGALPLSIILLVSAVTADELKIEKTKEVQCTRKTHNGDSIHVNYRGTLESNGEEFDSSYSRSKPFNFNLGAGMVIKGWDQGLLDMCIGEARKLTIPSRLAYGHNGVGKIPPDATLIFETELMAIDGVEEWELVEKPKPEEAGNATEAGHIEEGLEGHKNGPPDGHKHKGSDKGPKHDEDKKSGECQLLGPFALLIQGALGILALSSLVFKRYRETPRRPLKVWAFDASKQVVGSMLLHLANLLMSMLSSGQFDIDQKAKQAATFTQADEGRQPNPCSFYLLNLAIDVSIIHTFHIPKLTKSLDNNRHPHPSWPPPYPPRPLLSHRPRQPPSIPQLRKLRTPTQNNMVAQTIFHILPRSPRHETLRLSALPPPSLVRMGGRLGTPLDGGQGVGADYVCYAHIPVDYEWDAILHHRQLYQR